MSAARHFGLGVCVGAALAAAGTFWLMDRDRSADRPQDPPQPAQTSSQFDWTEHTASIASAPDTQPQASPPESARPLEPDAPVGPLNPEDLITGSHAEALARLGVPWPEEPAPPEPDQPATKPEREPIAETPLDEVPYPIWLYNPLQLCEDNYLSDAGGSDELPAIAHRDWNFVRYNLVGRTYVSEVRIGRWRKHRWSRAERDRTAAAMLRRMGKEEGWHDGELRAISEGLIWPGMKRDQLLLVAGSPYKHTKRRTVDRNEEVWYYHATEGRVYSGYIVLNHNSVENWDLK